MGCQIETIVDGWYVRESSPRMCTVDVAKTWKDAQEGRPESAPPNRWSTAAVMWLCLVTMARASRRSTGGPPYVST
jgi:hypothetical protein